MVSSNSVFTAQFAERACLEQTKPKALHHDETTSEEQSLKRLVLNGLTSTNTSTKRSRSESEDEGEQEHDVEGTWITDAEWGYENPDQHRRHIVATGNCASVATMLQIASMMGETPPSPTQPPRHRYKRRNSVVDAMLHPSTRQFLAGCQDVLPEQAPTRFKRSSLPWNFKSPSATGDSVTTPLSI